MLEPSEPALRRLAHHLLAHYQKGTRPVRDWRTTTNVAIDLMVYAILSVVSPPRVSAGRGTGPGLQHPPAMLCPSSGVSVPPF